MLLAPRLRSARARRRHLESGPGPVDYALPFELARIHAERGTYCRFAPEGRWCWVWSMLHSLYVVAGTALSAVVVLTLTGVLRRD